MNISNFKFRLAQLTSDLINDSAAILADMFNKENRVWSAMKLDLPEVETFMKAKLAEVIEWEEELRQNGIIGRKSFINMVYLSQEDEVIGVWVNYQLVQFLTRKSSIVFPHFDILQKYSEELNRSIDPRDIVPGRNLNGMFFTMKRQYMRMPEARLFLIDGTEWLYSQGFRNVMGRCSSYGAFLAISSEGVEVPITLEVEINGKKLDLFYVKWSIIPLCRRSFEQLLDLRASL